MEQEPLDLFVENLIQQSGLKLPEDFKRQYVEKLKEQVNSRLAMDMLADLDDAALAEYADLMNVEPQPDFTGLQQFFIAKIPDFQQKMQSSLADFASDFVAAAKK